MSWHLKRFNHGIPLAETGLTSILMISILSNS
jgi:hypothetical protein